MSFHLGFTELGGLPDDWFAKNYLICKDCGTPHAIMIARGIRTLEFFDFYDIVLTAFDSSAEDNAQKLIWSKCRCTRLEAKKRLDNLPVRLAHRLLDEEVNQWFSENDTTGMVIDCPLVERKRNPSFGTAKDQVLLSLLSPTELLNSSKWTEVPCTGPLTEDGWIMIDLQQCCYCSAVGSLISHFDPEDSCPICKQPTLELTLAYRT